VTDVFGQFYRGFYLASNSTNSISGEYYLRPDLDVNHIGASVQYILNHKRFSYRASFLQNEWQKKSAGTFIFGLEAYYGRVDADSTLIPTLVNNEEARREITEIKFIEFGPNAGYAYTLVVKRNFFLTGSASISLDYGETTISDRTGAHKATGVSPNTFFRIFGGYNSRKWAVSAVYVSNGVRLASESIDRQMVLSTGNIRLNFIYRFIPSRKTKKALDVVEEVGGS
jgi:hypothetical protein